MALEGKREKVFWEGRGEEGRKSDMCFSSMLLQCAARPSLPSIHPTSLPPSFPPSLPLLHRLPPTMSPTTFHPNAAPSTPLSPLAFLLYPLLSPGLPHHQEIKGEEGRMEGEGRHCCKISPFRLVQGDSLTSWVLRVPEKARSWIYCRTDSFKEG